MNTETQAQSKHALLLAIEGVAVCIGIDYRESVRIAYFVGILNYWPNSFVFSVS